LIQDLRKTKAALLASETQPQPDPSAETPSAPPERKNDAAEFEPGQIVFAKSNPSSRGAVVAVLAGKPENRFKVFIDGTTQTFYASQLQAEDQREEKENALPCDHSMPISPRFR
jgi:hypothetical protein